jgi:glutaredoxin
MKNSRKLKIKYMKNKAIFYHAGCPVCVDAEQLIVDTIDTERFEVEIVHLGENNSRLSEAEKFGVKSVPALVVGNHPYHINFGASIEDLK